MAKNFGQVCRNCILRVQRNILRGKKNLNKLIPTLVIFVFFGLYAKHFWTFSKTSRQVRQNCIPRVHRNFLKKYICLGKSLPNHFRTLNENFFTSGNKFSARLSKLLHMNEKFRLFNFLNLEAHRLKT